MSRQSRWNTSYCYQPIQCILEPTSQRRGLFIGSILAVSQGLLNSYKIGAVISLSLDPVDEDSDCFQNMYRLAITAEDHQRQKLCKYFQQCIQFIQQHITQRNVLVHCYAGISRSATIVLAFLVHRGHSLAESLQIVRRKRPIASPNKGFMHQLFEFEASKSRTQQFRHPNFVSQTRTSFFKKDFQTPSRTFFNLGQGPKRPLKINRRKQVCQQKKQYR